MNYFINKISVKTIGVLHLTYKDEGIIWVISVTFYYIKISARNEMVNYTGRATLWELKMLNKCISTVSPPPKERYLASNTSDANDKLESLKSGEEIKSTKKYKETLVYYKKIQHCSHIQMDLGTIIPLEGVEYVSANFLLEN